MLFIVHFPFFLYLISIIYSYLHLPLHFLLIPSLHSLLSTNLSKFIFSLSYIHLPVLLLLPVRFYLSFSDPHHHLFTYPFTYPLLLRPSSVPPPFSFPRYYPPFYFVPITSLFLLLFIGHSSQFRTSLLHPLLYPSFSSVYSCPSYLPPTLHPFSP